MLLLTNHAHPFYAPFNNAALAVLDLASSPTLEEITASYVTTLRVAQFGDLSQLDLALSIALAASSTTAVPPVHLVRSTKVRQALTVLILASSNFLSRPRTVASAMVMGRALTALRRTLDGTTEPQLSGSAALAALLAA